MTKATHIFDLENISEAQMMESILTEEGIAYQLINYQDGGTIFANMVSPARPQYAQLWCLPEDEPQVRVLYQALREADILINYAADQEDIGDD